MNQSFSSFYLPAGNAVYPGPHGIMEAQAACRAGPKSAPSRPAVRETSALLRKYEEAAVIGHRATAISKGAPILIPLLEGEDDAVVIAGKELRKCVLRGSIMRVHADGTTELWALQELKLPIDPAE